jgi:hypothetical protein
VEVPRDFFDDALKKYKSIRQTPQLADYAREGTIKLAEYRSAISNAPPGLAPLSIEEIQFVGQFLFLKGGLVGPHLIARGPAGSFEIDGVVADNVVFHDLTIVYRGGPFKLNNVWFVNCRFVVPRIPSGDQLLDAVVKQPANVQIG